MEYRYVLKNKHTGKLHFKHYSLTQIERQGLKLLFDVDNYEIISRDRGTGLKDNSKEKVKIFEGDTLEGYYYNGVVKFINSSFTLENKEEGFAPLQIMIEEDSELVITGNIH